MGTGRMTIRPIDSGRRMVEITAGLYKMGNDAHMNPLSTGSAGCGKLGRRRRNRRLACNFRVSRIVRKVSMTVMIVVAALAVLGLVTQARGVGVQRGLSPPGPIIDGLVAV